MGIITSVRNPKVQAARRLHQTRHRRETGRCLLEGPHMVKEGLAAGVYIRRVFYDPSWAESPAGIQLLERLTGVQAGRVGKRGVRPMELLPAGSNVLGAVSTTETPRGLVAVADSPETVSSGELAQTGEPLIGLDGIQDPGNVGGILRSSRAFGAAGAVLGQGTADPFSPKVLRASAGLALSMKIALADNLPGALGSLQGEGYKAVGLVPRGGRSPEEVAEQLLAPESGAFVLVVGNEGSGLSDEVEERLDARLTIRMADGVESLNTAVAAAVALYAFQQSCYNRSKPDDGEEQ